MKAPELHMILTAILLAAQSATPGVFEPAPIGPAVPDRRTENRPQQPELGSIELGRMDRFNACMDQAVEDPATGIVAANIWLSEGGIYHARHCLAFSYTRQQNWALATSEFEKAAREAASYGDVRSANLWAQAGNASLAGGEPLRAISFLDSALLVDGLTGQKRGEVHLDRARALVAAGRIDDAKADFAKVHELVPEDPLGWLLSATLARRTGDMDRALADITVAAKLAPQDADVALEAGNIAVSSGDYTSARRNWEQAVAIRKESRAANTAREYLIQLDKLETEEGTAQIRDR